MVWLRSIAVIFLLPLAGCATQPRTDFADAISHSREDIRRVMESSSAPGIAVAVTSGDRIVWMESLGVADLDRSEPLRTDTRFRIGSVSKILTATALMRLVDAGVVSLDDAVLRYLPQFPHGQITLRQLAGHLGGIRHYARGEYISRERFPTVTDSLRRFAADELVSAPGEKYLYSTYGYSVLGAALERAAGQPFEDLVRAHVLQPLQMRETSITAPAGSHTSTFYVRNNGVVTVAPEVDLSDRIPGGGYLSTARDLARLAIGTTSSGFLAPAGRRVMFTPQRTGDGTPTAVGIGWRVAADASGRMFVHHGGDAMGGRAFVLIYPEERVAVSIVSNLSFTPISVEEAGAIARRFIR